MTQATKVGARTGPKAFGDGYLFGVPLGELGWFATLLMGTAAGFVAFFAGTFFGILGIALWSGIEHRTLDYALSYRRVGLPLGLTVLVVAYAVLGTLRVKRMVRR